MNNQYDVLSPWADADPRSLKGITPRLTQLTEKKIGLFCNTKRASRPIFAVVEEKLKEKFPSCEISWWVPKERSYTTLQMESKDKDRFEEWVKGVDAVVASVGD